ncbi:hypothetical protein [Yoonia sp. 208BN28-4]|uniref:hypothetical protein n=1 Tax=Yoonia sp. 208BN28-4 TaxID=3126505 RepID=UPI0030A6A4A8
MTNDVDDDESEEPSRPTDIAIPPENLPKGHRQSFRNLRRDLSEDELSSPGVQKMVMDEFDRLDTELRIAQGDAAKYQSEAVKVARLEEKIKTHLGFEILSAGGIAIGPFFMALAYSNNESTLATPVAIGGAVILVAGIFAKVVKR